MRVANCKIGTANSLCRCTRAIFALPARAAAICPSASARRTLIHRIRNVSRDLHMMDMLGYFRRLFAYDTWANREVLSRLQTSGTPPSRSIQLLSHILSAERLWLERIERRKQTYPVWPDFSIIKCEAEATELTQLWRKYLGGIEPAQLAEIIKYTNTKGEAWSNSVSDILMHVVMHSAYHRGQIASDMRAAGHTPAYTDFIHGVRQRLVE